MLQSFTDWPLRLVRALVVIVFAIGPATTGHAAFEQQLDDVQHERLEAATHAYQIGDYGEAIEFFTDLANEGVGEAQFYLGFMNGQGLGMPQDYAVAAEWYEEAALQGHPQAQNYLGLLYFEGNGVARSFRDAFLYFELAAAAGNQDAGNNRLIVARKMTSAQITEAQKSAGEIIRALRSNVKKIVLPRRMASGVAVAGGNLFLTHASAVQACREITVRFENAEPREASLASIDRFNGLALLTASGAFAEPVPLREAPVEIGETVTIVGFGLDDKKRPVVEITDASIILDPALHRVDKRYLQLSSLVGSSQLGAAVVDAEGRLVGVMEPTLEAVKVAQIRGEPQRIGFAIRQELVHLLFEINGHRYEIRTEDDMPAAMVPDTVIDPVRAATVAIECWREQEGKDMPNGDQAAAEKEPAEPG